MPASAGLGIDALDQYAIFPDTRNHGFGLYRFTGHLIQYECQPAFVHVCKRSAIPLPDPPLSSRDEKILGFCTHCESFAPLTLHERLENPAEALHLLTDFQFLTR